MAGLLAVLDDQSNELGAHPGQRRQLLDRCDVEIDLLGRRGLARGDRRGAAKRAAITTAMPIATVRRSVIISSSD